MGSTSHPTDSDSKDKCVDTQYTQECDKHNKSDGNIQRYSDIYVPPLLDDFNGRTHSPTVTTQGSVPTKGRKMEITNKIVTSGDSRVGEHMSGRQETHLTDKSASGMDTIPADRTYQAIYQRHGIVREDGLGIRQDTLSPESDTKEKYGDTCDKKECDMEDISQAIRKSLSHQTRTRRKNMEIQRT